MFASGRGHRCHDLNVFVGPDEEQLYRQPRLGFRDFAALRFHHCNRSCPGIVGHLFRANCFEFTNLTVSWFDRMFTKKINSSL